MKKAVFILIILTTSLSFGQKAIYQSDAFDVLSKNHKVLAILPFAAKLELMDKKILYRENLKDLEQKEGYEVQNALQNYFLKGYKRKNYKVNFQDIKNTNAILTKNGIDLSNIDIYTSQELCKILKVDGIINGNLTINALISKGVSTSYDFVAFITGKSDYGRIAIKVSDGETGKLLWKYEKSINRKSGKNTFAIIEDMMKKATRKFPYDKQKKAK